MDVASLKKIWGDRIVLCATLGVQRTMSLSSAEEVRRETVRITGIPSALTAAVLSARLSATSS